MPALDSTLDQPPLWLAGFAAVEGDPGEDAVDGVLAPRAFQHWDDAVGGWAVEPGGFALRVGASAGDLPLTTTVTPSAG